MFNVSPIRVAHGDGIGPEIMTEAGARIETEVIENGGCTLAQGQ